MGFYEDDEDYYDNSRTYTTERKRKMIANDSTKHYPNKDEAAELRKIMSSTGLNEKEVRENSVYRKQLSDAQKAGQKRKRSEATKWYQLQIRKACRQTKLVPQHPETLKVLAEILKDANPRWLRHSAWMFGSGHILSAENAVKQYAKK
jgi:hypothetical protein